MVVKVLSVDLSTHTFVSGTNAVVTGGNYTHTWSGGTSTAAVISGGNYPHTFQNCYWFNS